jgi:hypothetical protein
MAWTWRGRSPGGGARGHPWPGFTRMVHRRASLHGGSPAEWFYRGARPRSDARAHSAGVTDCHSRTPSLGRPRVQWPDSKGRDSEGPARRPVGDAAPPPPRFFGARSIAVARAKQGKLLLSCKLVPLSLPLLSCNRLFRPRRPANRISSARAGEGHSTARGCARGARAVVRVHCVRMGCVRLARARPGGCVGTRLEGRPCE